MIFEIDDFPLMTTVEELVFAFAEEKSPGGTIEMVKDDLVGGR